MHALFPTSQIYHYMYNDIVILAFPRFKSKQVLTTQTVCKSLFNRLLAAVREALLPVHLLSFQHTLLSTSTGHGCPTVWVAADASRQCHPPTSRGGLAGRLASITNGSCGQGFLWEAVLYHIPCPLTGKLFSTICTCTLSIHVPVI